jgi:RHS repeat-associated protein
MDGYSYDASGNLLNDGTHSYTYDAESRIIKVDGGGTAAYVYDAEGRRVQKRTASGTVNYVYDIAGQQVAEVNSSGTLNRAEVYAGGWHLATYTNSTTYFNHTDWLGTERMRTGVSGTSCETIVSLPFGDGQATSGSCDPTPMHFTGKQRDPETNLDDFDARYYSSQWGRFISADWSSVPVPVPYANLANPQTLNLYAIVADDPATDVDADGHDLELAGDISADWNELCTAAGTSCNDMHLDPLSDRVSFNCDKMNDCDKLTAGAQQIKFWVDSPDLYVFAIWDIGGQYSLGVTRYPTLWTQIKDAAKDEAPDLAMNVGFAVVAAFMGPEDETLNPDIVKLGKALASEAQVAEKGTAIAGAGTQKVLRVAPKLAAKYGGDAADWAKMSSSSYQAAGEARSAAFETHWYENVVTGVKAEYKTVIAWMKESFKP